MVVRTGVGLQTTAAAGRVELTEVVEADLRCGLLGQFVRVLEVVERAVAQAACGYRAELFLDGFEGVAPVGVGDGEGDRVHGGEPSDRAGQVDAVEQVFAAVALHGEEYPVPAGPPGQYPTQRGQQHVVDLRAIGAGDLAQQNVRGLAIEPRGDGTRGPDRVGAV